MASRTLVLGCSKSVIVVFVVIFVLVEEDPPVIDNVLASSSKNGVKNDGSCGPVVPVRDGVAEGGATKKPCALSFNRARTERITRERLKEQCIMLLCING